MFESAGALRNVILPRERANSSLVTLTFFLSYCALFLSSNGRLHRYVSQIFSVYSIKYARMPAFTKLHRNYVNRYRPLCPLSYPSLFQRFTTL